MLEVLWNTILPVFSIIFLGFVLRRKGVIYPEFIKPANQIVYHAAIPAILFNTISEAPFKANFNVTAGLCLLAALCMVVLLGLLLARVLHVPEKSRGTFIHSGFHSNIGFMAYAIAYFALGEENFARTAILSSFIMVGQNFAAVWTLTALDPEAKAIHNRWAVFTRTLRNPIVLSVVAGILFSALEAPVPKVVHQSLGILSGMALPLALLLIGASLSFETFSARAGEIVAIGAMKLVCLPLFGYGIMVLAHVPQLLVLPGMILLASPTATITYVMAIELRGDPELAAASVSVLTLASALTYSVYISSLMG